VIREALVEDDGQVGPMAHLRPEAVLRRGARVGNFVEIKKSTIGPGAKVNHLTYIGDATVGARVNVGAGTITCNYDGEKKHRTVIEDDAFIGSNTQLVAPSPGRGLRGLRLHDHEGRSAGRARGGAREAAEHRGVGGAAQGQEEGGRLRCVGSSGISGRETRSRS
jgi:hypothetical protein